MSWPSWSPSGAAFRRARTAMSAAASASKTGSLSTVMVGWRWPGGWEPRPHEVDNRAVRQQQTKTNEAQRECEERGHGRLKRRGRKNAPKDGRKVLLSAPLDLLIACFGTGERLDGRRRSRLVQVVGRHGHPLVGDLARFCVPSCDTTRVPWMVLQCRVAVESLKETRRGRN
ncbi:hypothetical protein BKA80DRAFT_275618 [Phyllosticta citrichinensis]